MLNQMFSRKTPVLDMLKKRELLLRKTNNHTVILKKTSRGFTITNNTYYESYILRVTIEDNRLYITRWLMDWKSLSAYGLWNISNPDNRAIHHPNSGNIWIWRSKNEQYS